MTAVNWDTCSAETLMGVFMTNQATPSLHGGVVSDPLLIELFRNKRQGKLSFKKAMEGAKRWVYSSETTVR
jgi:hypothetical protein